MKLNTRIYKGSVEITNVSNSAEGISITSKTINTIKDRFSSIYDVEEHYKHSKSGISKGNIIPKMCIEGRTTTSSSDKYSVFYLHTTNTIKLENLIKNSILSAFGHMPAKDRHIIDGMTLKLGYNFVDFSGHKPVILVNEYELIVSYQEDKILRINKVSIVDNEKQELKTNEFNYHTDIYCFGNDSYEGTYYFYEFISDMSINPMRYPELKFESKDSKKLAEIFAKHIEREYGIFTTCGKGIYEGFMIEDIRKSLIRTEGEFVGIGRKEALKVFERNAPEILRKRMETGKM